MGGAVRESVAECDAGPALWLSFACPMVGGGAVSSLVGCATQLDQGSRGRRCISQAGGEAMGRQGAGGRRRGGSGESSCGCA